MNEKPEEKKPPSKNRKPAKAGAAAPVTDTAVLAQTELGAFKGTEPKTSVQAEPAAPAQPEAVSAEKADAAVNEAAENAGTEPAAPEASFTYPVTTDAERAEAHGQCEHHHGGHTHGEYHSKKRRVKRPENHAPTVTVNKLQLNADKLSPRAKTILTYLTIVAAGLMRALTTHIFIVQNEFVGGGFGGASVILQYATQLAHNNNSAFPVINSGIFLIAFNIPLVILAYFLVNKKFALRTLVVAGSASVFLVLLGLIEDALPDGITLQYVASPDSRILAAVAGGVLSGLGVALVLKSGASNGGTDVIATIIQKKHRGTNIAWFILALDSITVVVSIFVYRQPGQFINFQPLILSGILMFLSSKMTEIILEGVKSALKFEIVTTHPEELSDEIMTALGRGVTLLPAKGMYTKTDKAVLICVIRRRQITQLQNIIKRYPETFCYISSTSDVMGKF